MKDVTGGELVDSAKRIEAPRLGSCGNCALGGKKECPYAINPPIQMKKMTGEESCSAFIAKTL